MILWASKINFNAMNMLQKMILEEHELGNSKALTLHYLVYYWVLGTNLTCVKLAIKSFTITMHLSIYCNLFRNSWWSNVELAVKCKKVEEFWKIATSKRDTTFSQWKWWYTGTITTSVINIWANITSYCEYRTLNAQTIITILVI